MKMSLLNKKTRRPSSSVEEDVVYVNSTVLQRDVSRMVELKDVENNNHTPPSTDYSQVKVPKYLSDMITGVYNVSQQDKYKDLMLSSILSDEVFSGSVSSIVNSWSNIETEDISGIVSRASLNEFNKRQMLISAPIMHNVIPQGRHHLYDDVPNSFKDLDFSFIPRLAKSWLSAYNNGKKFTSHDFSHTKSPRLTSQGILLKGVREHPKLRFCRKALQAKLATKYSSADLIDKFYDRLNNLSKSYGYDFDFRNTIASIRRQQISKLEEVQSRSASLPSNDIDHYTLGVQGRVRGIFMPNELDKIYRKSCGDVVKHMLFNHHPVFLVSPDSVNRAISAIALCHNQFSSDELLSNNLGTVNAYDLSEFDRTQHKGCYYLYQSMMTEMFDNFDAHYDIEFFAKRGIITSSGPYPNSSIINYHTRGRSKLSGEPEVTISNNIIAYLVFLRAWANVLNLDPVDIDSRLRSKFDNKFFAKIHGDDACHHLSDNLEDYIKFRDEYNKSGLILEFERIPAYLKKVDSSLFLDKKGNSIKPGTIYGIPGSIFKNRFGEYPRTAEVVIVASICDTLQLIPDNTFYYEIYKDFCDIIIDKCTKFSHYEEAKIYYDSPDFIKDMTEYATTSIRNASEVKHILDRYYYTNGETFINESLESIYGSLEYNEEVIKQFSFPDTIKELEDLIIEEQTVIFESSGTRTALEKFLL